MLNQEIFTNMDTPVLLVNTSSNNIKRVLNIFHLANNSYYPLNTSNACNMPQVNHGHHAAHHPHHIPICFNCGKLHLLPDCKSPRNESTIAHSRKVYMDKHPDGPPRNGGLKKWTKVGRGDGSDRSHGYGFKLMGKKWMCFCERMECGWNSTHTSRFHAAWEKNK